jgi:hypothetical protein
LGHHLELARPGMMSRYHQRCESDIRNNFDPCQRQAVAMRIGCSR